MNLTQILDQNVKGKTIKHLEVNALLRETLHDLGLYRVLR